MVDTILQALKKTSKGSLQYDRLWLTEGRAKDILYDVSCLTRIHYVPTEEEHSPVQQNEEGREPETQPQNLVIQHQQQQQQQQHASPTKLPDVLQDTCSDILCFEENRKKLVQGSVQNYVSGIASIEEQYRRQIAQQMALLQHGWKLENQRKKDQLAQLQVQELMEVREQQSKLKEHQKTHTKRLNEKMRKMEEKQKQLEEQELKRKQDQEERLHQVLAVQSHLQAMCTSFGETLATCLNPGLLTQEPQHHLKVIVNSQQALKDILTNRQEITLEDAQQAQQHFLNSKVALTNLQNDVVQANSKHRENEQKAETPSSPGRRNHQMPTSPQETTTSEKDTTQQQQQQQQEQEMLMTDSKKADLSKDLGILTGCVDNERYVLYIKLINSTKEWEAIYHPLETDPKFKRLQFEMKKAVNTPVNAISSQSGRQLRDKLDRLLCLLSQKPVPGADGRPSFSCQSHPLALHFCAHLLAKKIVSQAESVVSSHQEAAFPLAAVAVGLWSRFPKFGELLLTQLYIKCPYLLPIYHQQTKGQEEKAFHNLLGYKYENGEMEDQCQFLKRMSGIVCFYAALIQTPAPPGYSAMHPHGIQHGWQYLSTLVNLRPRFDITATVLFHFLEVAGSAIYRTYGRQMRKLLYYLRNEYISQIRKVTVSESLGPVSRLESFLVDSEKSGRIPPPAGMLTAGFWNT